MAKRRVAYVVSMDLIKVSSLLPSNRNRSALVHSLASALGLFKGGEGNPLYTLKPERATPEELRLYHDQDYIDFVLRYDKTNGNSSKSSPDSGSSDSAAVAEFGLQDDCPLFRGLSSYVPLVGGASLTACRVLRDGRANVAIVWDGGRHHARKSHASGFCYVADCVLSILSLKRPTSPNSPRPRIMYLDLDLHFADAVSEAFSSTSSSASSVLTLSIHHAAPGFFPASSRASLTSATSSDLYNLSIPLSRGASCETFHRIWESAVELVKDAFDPEYVILQCGVDGLAGDPCAIWNWEIDVEKEGSLGWCVKKVMSWKRKTLVLGGGGYNSPDVARAWAYLTSIISEKPLPTNTEVPDHLFFPLYAPSFTMTIPRGNMRDENTEEDLQVICNNFRSLVEMLRIQ